MKIDNLEKAALVFMLLEMYDECAEYIDLAIRANPSSSIAYDLQGLLALKKEQYDEAIVSFDQAISINPNFALAYYNRAIAKRYLGDSRSD